MNELHEHKKSDAVRWAVVFILIAVLAAGTAGAWTVLLRDGHAGGAEEQPREEAVCPGPAATDGEGNAMESGVVYAMPAAMVFAATAAEQSSAGDGITLQATVIPEAADNKAVVWSVTFADPASAWAAGRTVTDYVTVTPSAEDGTQATVKCLQAFGAQITVTVTSRLNAHAKAECVLDYARRITDMSLWSERTDSRLTEFGADEILPDLVMPSFQEFESAMDNGTVWAGGYGYLYGAGTPDEAEQADPEQAWADEYEARCFTFSDHTVKDNRILTANPDTDEYYAVQVTKTAVHAEIRNLYAELAAELKGRQHTDAEIWDADYGRFRAGNNPFAILASGDGGKWLATPHWTEALYNRYAVAFVEWCKAHPDTAICEITYAFTGKYSAFSKTFAFRYNPASVVTPVFAVTTDTGAAVL